MTRFALLLGVSLSACAPAPEVPKPPARPAFAFLRSSMIPYPEGASSSRLVATDRASGRVSSYDAALVTLVAIRRGTREEAASLVRGLLALQREDGSVPFSFVLPRPTDPVPYVRSGAVAWVGYAATEYLDADAAGPSRAEALALARGCARYLLGRVVEAPGDPREGLIRGGEGTFRYELDARGAVRERLEAEDIAWASVEHNIDAFFFFRALARVTAEKPYAQAADRIGRGLARAWMSSSGQLARGLGVTGPDDLPMLDCASWASLFLAAAGERERAETAASVADAGFASRDPKTGTRGHRAQRRGAVIESELLRRSVGDKLPARDWAELEAVWPEGSAGVALAALRVGRSERARAILDALEPLRAPDGSLPTSTAEVPFVFDTRPSIAGTAWVELVRFELERDKGRSTLWVP